MSEDTKSFCFAFGCILAGFILFILIVTFCVLIARPSIEESNRMESVKAFCESVKGEYGGGECFKDGKKVEIEE